jgi:hypothetical protein
VGFSLGLRNVWNYLLSSSAVAASGSASASLIGGELKMKKHMEDDPWGQQYAGMGSSSPVTSMY